MRAWRTLKASGAAVLRDGVYLMPEREVCRDTLETVAAEVISGGGKAYVFRVEEPDGSNFTTLFDRTEEYTALLLNVARVRNALTADTVLDVLKQSRKLRKSLTNISAIDFFSGEARNQADAALQDLELAVACVLNPDEPHPVKRIIPRLLVSEHQGRTWATRRRPWVDRLACAWLIQRFIDPQARILWLEPPYDCPPDVLGFDFDGATFSHVGNRVTFEVLLASFNLEQAELARMGALVHCLDTGGVQPPEATGVESVLAGLRISIKDDDQLLAAAKGVFEGLLATFQRKSTLQESST